MKFILGLFIGAVLGAIGAVMYSVSTGRDLREEYAGVRDGCGVILVWTRDYMEQNR